MLLADQLSRSLMFLSLQLSVSTARRSLVSMDSRKTSGRLYEGDTEETFRDRRRLVRLLVAEVAAGEKREDGTSEVRITYRFDPPEGEAWVVGTVPKGTSFSKAKQATAPAV